MQHGNMPKPDSDVLFNIFCIFMYKETEIDLDI